MIFIDVAEDKKNIQLHFSGDAFIDVLNFVKSHHFKYNPSNKTWCTLPRRVASLLMNLGDIDDCQITPQAHYLLENNLISKETKFIREKFNFDLLKVPALKGKSPFETFQIEDTKKGISQNRLLLAHEMGLGKTKIAIDILNHLWANKKIDKILIVTPIEGLYNWKRELQHFSNFWAEDDILISTASSNRNFLNYTESIVILTYRHFLTVSDDYYKLLNPQEENVKRYRNPPIPFGKWGENRAIILDESHKMKNKKARITHTLNLHKQFFYYRYLLTGTPAPNGIKDYYTQLKFLDEGSIQEDYYEWLPKIANCGNRFSDYAVNFYYPERVEKFINSIKPWIIRRFANNCLDLPSLLIKKIYVELNKAQKQIYFDLLKYTLSTLEKQDKFVSVKKVINKFPYLSLALDNPKILLDSPIDNSFLRQKLKSWNFETHSKLKVCDSLFQSCIENGEKVIIWTGHPLTAELLAEHYKKYNPIVIHGQIKIPNNITTSEYRDSIIEQFKTNPDKKLLIGSYKVMGLTINLTEISKNIYFDRSYDLTEWLQSIKRTHRFGQSKRVIVYPIIIENSLDERLDKRLTLKEDINKNLLNRKQLTKEEWENIFLGRE